MRPALLGWAALALIALAQPGVRERAAALYLGDDFWTLAPLARAGLAAIAVLAISLWFWLAARLARRAWAVLGVAPIAWLEAAALGALFALLHTASPQLFYTYYQLIIPGLPSQWVIAAPRADVLWPGLSFAVEARLAEHLAAGVLWATLLTAFGRRARGPRLCAAAAAIIAAPWIIRAFS